MKNVIINRAKFDIMPDNKDVCKGKSVLCITTGEVFKSAKEAANHYNIGYNNLIQCLNHYQSQCGGGSRNYNGNGLKFCYIAEMGYKANDISHYIIELKAKAEVNAEQTQRILEEYRRLKEANEEYMKKTDAMMSELIQLVG